MSALSQLVRRGKDPLLQVIERMVSFLLVPGLELAGSGWGGPGRGLPQQRIARRSGPWRGAGQQFTQMPGLGHARARGLRAWPNLARCPWAGGG